MLPRACTDSEHDAPRAGGGLAAVTAEPHDPRDTVADCTVRRARAVIAGTAVTTLSVLRHDRPQVIAASGELHGHIDAIQHDLADSRGREVLLHGAILHSNDLRAERRWPEFTRRPTAHTELLSILVLPVRRHQRVVAALSFYATKPGPFDDAAIQAGRLLAGSAGICLAAAGEREKAANLEIALRSNRTIGMAMGGPMAQHRISSEQAFDLLRAASQHTHRKLAELATDVVETGALNVRPGAPPYPGSDVVNLAHEAALTGPRLINKPHPREGRTP